MKIEFEKKGDYKLYISNKITKIDIPKDQQIERGRKHLRIGVTNNGYSVANNCEAKIEIFNLIDKKIEADSKLTWDIKLHPNYSSNEYNKRYAPIDIKKQDTEYLDFSSLQYSRSKSDDDFKPAETIHISTYPSIQINPKTKYKVIISVYSNNAKPSSFSFTINWDGTIEGFDKAFYKE